MPYYVQIFLNGCFMIRLLNRIIANTIFLNDCLMRRLLNKIPFNATFCSKFFKSLMNEKAFK
jgi:hypothetical protein